jgi:hypothetical protein
MRLYAKRLATIWLLISPQRLPRQGNQRDRSSVWSPLTSGARLPGVLVDLWRRAARRRWRPA